MVMKVDDAPGDRWFFMLTLAQFALHTTYVYCFIHLFVKLSILLSYFRVFALTYLRTRFAVYAVMVYVVLWACLMLIVTSIQW